MSTTDSTIPPWRTVEHHQLAEPGPTQEEMLDAVRRAIQEQRLENPPHYMPMPPAPPSVDAVADAVIERLKASVPGEVAEMAGDAVSLDEVACCALIDALRERRWDRAAMKVERLSREGGNLLVLTMPESADGRDGASVADDMEGFCRNASEAGFPTTFMILPHGVTLDVLRLRKEA